MRRSIMIAIAFLALAGNSYAVDFAQYGFEPQGEKRVDGLPYTVLKDASGLLVLYYADIDPTEKDMLGLKAAIAVVAGWEGVTVAEFRYMIRSGVASAVIIPSRVTFDGKNLLPYVQSGIRFNFGDSMEYDFRIRSGDFSLRVKGVYSSEKALLSAVDSAAQDPANYFAKRDPQYLLTRIEELEEALASSDGAFATYRDQVESAFADYKAQAEAALTAERERSEAKSVELSARLDAIVADSAATTGQLGDLVEALRWALASEMNHGFFGGYRPLDRDAVLAIIAMKKAEPALDRKTATDRAAKEKLKINGWEIQIVFYVWFGEPL